jgi:hypothetical protein
MSASCWFYWLDNVVYGMSISGLEEMRQVWRISFWWADGVEGKDEDSDGGGDGGCGSADG